MPSLHQSVLGLLDEHEGFERLADHLGSDRAQVTSAAGRVVPAIIAGLASRAGLDDGPAVVAALLDGDDGSAVLDPAGLIAAIEDVDRDRSSAGADGATDGEPVIDADADTKLDGLVDTVFGDDREDVLGDVAAAVEMGRSMTGELVSTLAPVVVWALGRRRADGALDAVAVAELLASEHRSLSEVGLLDSIGALRLHEPARVGVGGGGDRSVGVGGGGDHGRGTGDGHSIGGGRGTGGRTTAVSMAAGAPAMSGTGTGAESSATVVGGPDVDSGDRGAIVGNRSANTGVAAGGVLTPRRADGGRQGALGWLWWALGAAMLVLFLAWLLSTCDGGTVETDARTSLVDVGTAADTGGDEALDTADDRAAVAAPATSTSVTSVTSTPPSTPPSTAPSTVPTTATTGIEPSPEPTDDELQALVDTALGGSDVSGVVTDRIAALSGTVRTEIDRMAALAAVATVPGLASIDDAIVVEEALEEGTGTGEGDEAAVPVGAVVAGATINELLDLDPVTFEISSDRITADGRAVLDEVAAFLQGNPTVRVEIGGHTDNDGKVDANLDLSRRRAVSVKAYLEGRGVDGRRLETEGYGEDRPLVPNDSSAAKAENRRIEFTVL